MNTISGNNTGAVQLTIIPNESAQTNYTIGSETSGSVFAFTRARMVTFIAQALKPNTVYHPFFNDTWVGEYCTTVDQPTINSNGKIDSSQRQIKTDNLGNVTGNFFIPGNTFASGSLVFKLVDRKKEIPAASGLWVADPIYGSAEAYYESGTVLKEVQNQLTVSANQNSSGLVTPTVGGVLELAPLKTYYQRYFEYTLTSEDTSTFTITTDSATPPTPQAQTGSVEFPAGASNDVVHVSTVAVGDGTYTHTFSYSSTGAPRTQKFRQEWVGLDGETPPSLTGFRPTGIADDVECTVTTTWSTPVAVVGPQVYGSRVPSRTDPIAQSFSISEKQFPNGIYATSVGVYFRTVDHAAQAILEIRTMENGLPGTQILPGGVSVVPGTAAQASVNGTVPTIFRFAHPIYLMAGNTYCFVLKSSSLGYTAWTSIVGKIDAATGKVIDSNPYAGTMFKSENNYTWVPSPLEDLKFDLYKANFDTSTVAELIFTPAEFTINEDTGEYAANRDPLDPDLVTNYYSVSQTLPLSYITTVRQGTDSGTYFTGVSNGDTTGKTVRLKVPSHSVNEGDLIFLRGVPTPAKADEYNGIRANQLYGQYPVQSVLDSDHITINVGGRGDDLAATKTGPIALPETYGVLSNEPGMLPNFPTMVLAEPHTDPNGLGMKVYPTTSESFVQPTPPLVVSQNHFVIYTNIRINEANLDYVGSVVKSPSGVEIAGITETVRLAGLDPTTGLYLPISESENVTDTFDASSKFVVFNTPRLLANPLNEANNAVDLGTDTDLDYPTTCKISIGMSSISKDVSPAIDLSGMNLLVRTYRIDNQGFEFIDSEGGPVITTLDHYRDPTMNSELAATGGIAVAKYKSKEVQLDSACNKLKLFVTGNCPDPADGGECRFDVYLRMSSDASTHGDMPWTYLANRDDDGEETPDFTNSPNRNTVNEWYYELPDTANYFSIFDVKIVMRSTNTCFVPKIFGIRAISSVKLPSI